MSESLGYPSAGVAGQDRTRTLFAQTMQYVAVTAGLFALGAYLGRQLHGGVGIVAFLVAFGCLIGLQFAVRKSAELSVALLGGFGLLIGVAVAPLLAFYAGTNPQVLWQAGGATALFVTGLGAAGYATRRDLSVLGRVGTWALIGLIGFGVVLIFVRIPNGALIYSILGLIIYAGLTLYDFQRLRRSTDTESPLLLAASIFLDILNVFLLFLQLFSRPGEP